MILIVVDGSSFQTNLMVENLETSSSLLLHAKLNTIMNVNKNIMRCFIILFRKKIGRIVLPII